MILDATSRVQVCDLQCPTLAAFIVALQEGMMD